MCQWIQASHGLHGLNPNHNRRPPGRHDARDLLDDAAVERLRVADVLRENQLERLVFHRQRARRAEHIAGERVAGRVQARRRQMRDIRAQIPRRRIRLQQQRAAARLAGRVRGQDAKLLAQQRLDLRQRVKRSGGGSHAGCSGTERSAKCNALMPT